MTVGGGGGRTPATADGSDAAVTGLRAPAAAEDERDLEHRR